jgi:hypothetical protein
MKECKLWPSSTQNTQIKLFMNHQIRSVGKLIEVERKPIEEKPNNKREISRLRAARIQFVGVMQSLFCSHILFYVLYFCIGNNNNEKSSTIKANEMFLSQL